MATERVPTPLTLEMLAQRLDDLEALVEAYQDRIERVLDRQGEIRDREVSRLREHLREKDDEVYSLRNDLSRLRSEMQRSGSGRGW